MKRKANLENNRSDFIALVTKSVVGAIPFAGTLLSELVGVTIPNQRIDRLTKYIKELENKISKIPEAVVNDLKLSEQFIDLIEEGFVHASRATSDERRSYITSIIENGINDDSVDYQDSKYLMKLLAELNDIEIIWLRFYLTPTITGDTKFRNKHKNVLTPIRTYKGADRETSNKSSIQESYKEHLERLNLIESHLRFDRKTGLPIFDNTTGKPKTSNRRITHLGIMLLEQIGLINKE